MAEATSGGTVRGLHCRPEPAGHTQLVLVPAGGKDGAFSKPRLRLALKVVAEPEHPWESSS